MPAFVPDLSVILTFALAAFVLAITPGPDMALQMSRAINYGRAHGLATAAGAMSGHRGAYQLCALGISVLIVAAPTAFWVLKIVGRGLSALAGLSGDHAWRRVAAERERAARLPTLRESYLTGVGINLLNPKVVLFFVTFLPQFVDRHDAAAPGKLFFLGGEFIVISIPLAIVMVLGGRTAGGGAAQEPMGRPGAELELCRRVHGLCRDDPVRRGAEKLLAQSLNS